MLAPAEAERVAKIEKEQNRMNCETGLGSCNHSPLTSEERVEVSDFEREHNPLECETGESLCSKSALTPAEAEQVLPAPIRVFKEISRQYPRSTGIHI
jgi:hypothetical protein